MGKSRLDYSGCSLKELQEAVKKERDNHLNNQGLSKKTAIERARIRLNACASDVRKYNHWNQANPVVRGDKNYTSYPIEQHIIRIHTLTESINILNTIQVDQQRIEPFKKTKQHIFHYSGLVEAVNRILKEIAVFNKTVSIDPNIIGHLSSFSITYLEKSLSAIPLSLFTHLRDTDNPQQINYDSLQLLYRIYKHGLMLLCFSSKEATVAIEGTLPYLCNEQFPTEAEIVTLREIDNKLKKLVEETQEQNARLVSSLTFEIQTRLARIQSKDRIKYLPIKEEDMIQLILAVAQVYKIPQLVDATIDSYIEEIKEGLKNLSHYFHSYTSEEPEITLFPTLDLFNRCIAQLESPNRYQVDAIQEAAKLLSTNTAERCSTKTLPFPYYQPGTEQDRLELGSDASSSEEEDEQQYELPGLRAFS